MVSLVCHYPTMSWNQPQIVQRNDLLTSHPPSRLLSSSPSSGKISPSLLLFIIIIVAVIFFIACVLHLLVRFLTKHRSSSVSESNRYPEMSGPDVFQRQLQQLFHLHDSGLDQAFIDALPVFLYKEIKGLNEPFDCPVCLSEFSEKDQLRLLPTCSHAFHIDCIDTWLLSNSTCPLCRGALYAPGIAIENPIFDFDDLREEDGCLGNGESGALAGQKTGENEIVCEKVFSVRLGKFRSTNEEEGGGGGGGDGRGGGVEGETSSSNLDARRCYSMGSYQYVVADLELEVALRPKRGGGGDNVRLMNGGRVGQNANSNSEGGGDAEGKKINSGSKGESFSVSKIWLWPKKGKFPSAAETHMGRNSSVTVGLPWTQRSQDATT